MIKVFTDIIQFRGSHYDFGFMQGKKLGNSTYMKNRKKLFNGLERKFTADVDHVTPLLNRIAPLLIDELQGLADALELDLQTAFLYFSGYFAAPKSGCSIFIGDDYFVRNYDNDPLSYDGRYVLFQPTEGGYASIGPSMLVTGRTDGLNEKGLVVGYNYVNSKNSGDGFVCNMIGRLLLERCANVDEAIQLLHYIPHKHAFNYCLLDASGRSVIVEASARQVVTREGFICTNHFQRLTEENRYRTEDSVQRETIMLQRKKGQTFPFNEAFRMLNDMGAGVFATKYGAWDGTLHTAAYFPQSLTAMLAIGGNQQPLPISFSKWLEGGTLAFTKINGQLDANVGFANT